MKIGNQRLQCLENAANSFTANSTCKESSILL